MELKLMIIILLTTQATATYRLKQIKPGFIIEELGSAFIQHNSIKIEVSIAKEKLRKTKETLNGFVEKIDKMCIKYMESDLCKNPQTSEIETTKRLVDLLSGELNKKNKRDVTDVALSLLGWRRISEWDEYNLKIIHNNEKTMETEIIQAQKYAVQLKNYIIAEKQHRQRRIDLLESEMQKALNDTNEKTINTIIELSMMELVWIIEGQVVDIRRQLDAIGHSIDRNRKITTTEIYDIIKDKETITKIEETCGIHKRTSLNRATIFTKNTGKFLNATITIPIYENTPLHVYKLTAIPQITGNNTIIIPSMEAAPQKIPTNTSR